MMDASGLGVSYGYAALVGYLLTCCCGQPLICDTSAEKLAPPVISFLERQKMIITLDIKFANSLTARLFD